MVKLDHWGPGRAGGHMAGFAGVRSVHVARCRCGDLSGGNRAVMAGEAGAGDRAVVNLKGDPLVGVIVAALAGVGRFDVGGRLGRGLGAVMAGEAGSGDADMVKGRGFPGCEGGVAVFADI